MKFNLSNFLCRLQKKHLYINKNAWEPQTEKAIPSYFRIALPRKKGALSPIFFPANIVA
jgi:hypothetical protein